MTRVVLDKSRKSRHKTRLRYHTLVLVAVGMCFVLIVAFIRPFTAINLWMSDQMFVSEPPSANIVVVGIDDDSLLTYGRWSEWPRRLHAQAIRNLKAAGARVIGLDILFVEGSSDDELLASEIRAAGNVVLPVAGTGLLPNLTSEPVFSRTLAPTGPIGSAVKVTGHANMSPDHDGTVRRLPLVMRDTGGQVYPAFALAVLEVLFPSKTPPQYVINGHSLPVFGRSIPVDGAAGMRVNFSGNMAGFDYISYGDVISGEFDHAVVKNKIVLVGMTATGDLDAWSVPTADTKVPGVLVQAEAVDTILRQRFLTDVRPLVTVAVLALFGLVISLGLPRLRFRWGLPLLAGVFVTYLAAAFISFDSGLALDLLYPLSLLPVLLISSLICTIVIEQSERRLVKDLFGRYVSPQVAKEILSLADSGSLRLGGESREVTVLFADIRDFTRMSERLSPEAVVNLLNAHLSVVIEKVLENGGMVNKFAGDNIMAVWNSPQSQQDHAQLAVRAAWEAQQAVAAIPQNSEWGQQVRFGFGINTGYAVAGNVGSRGRVEYTVIGDCVNLASRICSVAPGGEVWIGETTYEQARGHVEAVSQGPQTVKGKAEPVTMYKVTGCK